MTEMADEDYSSKVMSMLVSSFPQQAPIPEMYLTQLISLGVGKPKRILQMMVDPNEGILAQSKFLPSIAEVSDWIKSKTPKSFLSPRSTLPEHKLLPPAKAEELSDEERKAKADQLHELARQMRLKAIADKPPSKLVWKQYHDPKELLKALENLENQKP